MIFLHLRGDPLKTRREMSVTEFCFTLGSETARLVMQVRLLRSSPQGNVSDRLLEETSQIVSDQILADRKKLESQEHLPEEKRILGQLHVLPSVLLHNLKDVTGGGST